MSRASLSRQSSSTQLSLMQQAKTLLEGHLLKRSSNKIISWKRRYFMVFEDDPNVYYFKNKKSLKSPSGYINLKQVTSVTELDSKQFGFRVSTPKKIWELAAESDIEKSMWINFLDSIVKKSELKKTSEAEEKLKKHWLQEKSKMLEDTQKELQEEKNKNQALTKLESDLKNKIDHLEANHFVEMTSLRKTYEDQFQKDLEARRKDIEEPLRKNINALEAEICALKSQISTLNTESHSKTLSYQQEIQAQCETINELNKSLNEWKAKYESLDAKYSNSEEEFRSIKDNFQEFKSEIEAEKQRVFRIRRDLELQTLKLETERSLHEQRESNFLIEKESLYMLREDLDKKVVELEFMKNEYLKEKRQLEEEKNNFKILMNNFNHKQMEYEGIMNVLESNLDIIGKSLVAKKKLIYELRLGNRNYKTQILNLTKQLEQVNLENATLRQHKTSSQELKLLYEVQRKELEALKREYLHTNSTQQLENEIATHNIEHGVSTDHVDQDSTYIAVTSTDLVNNEELVRNEEFSKIENATGDITSCENEFISSSTDEEQSSNYSMKKDEINNSS